MKGAAASNCGAMAVGRLRARPMNIDSDGGTMAALRLP
jgi:hypothetical protein